MNEAKVSMVKCCFWCLKPLEEGRILKDDDKLVFESYEPCEKCAELFSHGIQVIGVSPNMVMPGMAPVTKDDKGNPLYPTGAMFLTTEQWVRELLKEEHEKDMLKEVLAARKLLMPDEIVGMLVAELDEQEVPDLVEDEVNADN